MKTSEFRRWLLAQGVEMKEGAKHTKLYCNGRQSTLARHKSEIPEGTRKAIRKALGLKP